MNTLEQLANEELVARLNYRELNKPAEAAKKKWMGALKAYNSELLYEKVKRQVMRDLINAAGDATLIGQAAPDQKRGVVCASFNAG